ncbi:MAG: GNAT family N-acetyltransferase [Alphaproteobacteria bacterium]|nr:GNAT family N-acetyltransferase [Alphaproteobacteria bacterium]
MSVAFRAMRPGEENAVAAMIRQLPKDLGLHAQVAITGDALREAADTIRITVADNSGLLLGTCLWMITFSTWRGVKGMYVCDMFVMSHMRGQKLGERLLRAAAKQAAAEGARYIKLEASAENLRPAQFYTKLKFEVATKDHLMFLEPNNFQHFIAEQEK